MDMSYKGVVFDFNGTLFWDTLYHNRAWELFFKKHGIQMPDTEKDTLIHGKNNTSILVELFGRDLDDGTLTKYSNEKESIYRGICVKEGMSLAPGAEELIEYLVSRKIRINIATASVYENARFFIRKFSLDRWFDPDKIIYDDGIVKSKPHPDFYIRAIQALGLDPPVCVVIEDSIAGIHSAKNAGAGKIFMIRRKSDYTAPGWVTAIRTFDDIDRHLF
jgi:beta-phosphoglucomutase